MQKALPSRLEPTWEIAELYPAQGCWTEDDYLELDTNRLIEYSDGFLEFLPMATTSHQQIMAFLYGLLLGFVNARDLGTVLFAPLPIRLWAGKFREPDVLFMAKSHSSRMREQYWIGADLVMEVVSGKGKDKHRQRDLVTKRREYARAKIGEYWIVDRDKERILVYRLIAKRYVLHGKFGKGTVATSHSLPGFSVDVYAVMSASTKPARKSKRPPR